MPETECTTVALKKLSQWTYGFSRRSWFAGRPNRRLIAYAQSWNNTWTSGRVHHEGLATRTTSVRLTSLSSQEPHGSNVEQLTLILTIIFIQHPVTVTYTVERLSGDTNNLTSRRRQQIFWSDISTLQLNVFQLFYSHVLLYSWSDNTELYYSFIFHARLGQTRGPPSVKTRPAGVTPANRSYDAGGYATQVLYTDRTERGQVRKREQTTKADHRGTNN